jgi:hypothetical protein
VTWPGQLERSHQIALGNRDDVLRVIDEASESDAAIRLMDVTNRAGLDAFLDDVDRVLANYVNALYALREHLEKSGVDGDYRKDALRVLRTEAVELALFVRRYGTHERPPISMANMTITSLPGSGPPFELSFGPVLVVADLSTSKKKPNDKAKAYMDRHTKDIPVRELVAESGADVESSLRLLRRS